MNKITSTDNYEGTDETEKMVKKIIQVLSKKAQILKSEELSVLDVFDIPGKGPVIRRVKQFTKLTDTIPYDINVPDCEPVIHMGRSDDENYVGFKQNSVESGVAGIIRREVHQSLLLPSNELRSVLSGLGIEKLQRIYDLIGQIG